MYSTNIWALSSAIRSLPLINPTPFRLGVYQWKTTYDLRLKSCMCGIYLVCLCLCLCVVTSQSLFWLVSIRSCCLVVILIWRFGDFSFDHEIECTPPLLIITCIVKCHEAMYTQYCLVRRTKMIPNVHYTLIHQTYCLPNIPHMWYI